MGLGPADEISIGQGVAQGIVVEVGQAGIGQLGRLSCRRSLKQQQPQQQHEGQEGAASLRALPPAQHDAVSACLSRACLSEAALRTGSTTLGKEPGGPPFLLRKEPGGPPFLPCLSEI